MSKRNCADCGRDKDIRGGKICEKAGHFICQTCVYKGTGGGLLGSGKKSCPVCIGHSPLR